MIIITGAAGGLGTAVTARLARDRKVHALVRKQSQLDALGVGGGLCDVTDEESVAEAFAAAGPFRGVAHLVGGYTGGVPIWDAELRDLDKMMVLNLRSAFLVVRQGARLLRPHGGSIVCVGSITGRTGAAGHAAYAATKAALHSLVRSAAADLASSGVRVNAVLPGMIATPANLAAMPGADHGDWVTPGQIADTMAFLLGPESVGVTGACVEVAAGGYAP